MKVLKALVILLLIWLALGCVIFFESAFSLPWLGFFCTLLLLCILPQRLVLPVVIGATAWLSYWYLQPWWAVFLLVFLLVTLARAFRYSRYVYLGFMGCYILGMVIWTLAVPHTTSSLWLLQVGILTALLLVVWRSQLLTRDLQVWYIR